MNNLTTFSFLRHDQRLDVTSIGYELSYERLRPFNDKLGNAAVSAYNDPIRYSVPSDMVSSSPVTILLNPRIVS